MPGGPFAWQPRGLAAVGEYLERALAGPEAVEAVSGLLRLASALRRQLGSAPAANELSVMLRRTPGVIPLVRATWGAERGRTALARFHSSLGEAPAPKLVPPARGASTPGTPLRALIDPMDRDKRRARKI
ncbi:hypothetical protein L6R52_10465 [Myxococcota bacterium]|nr:hypothetical protein [Myxococcota bacterium]